MYSSGGRTGLGKRKVSLLEQTPGGSKVPHRVPHRRFILTFDPCQATSTTTSAETRVRHMKSANGCLFTGYVYVKRAHACLRCLQVQKCVSCVVLYVCVVCKKCIPHVFAVNP